MLLPRAMPMRIRCAQHLALSEVAARAKMKSGKEKDSLRQRWKPVFIVEFCLYRR